MCAGWSAVQSLEYKIKIRNIFLDFSYGRKINYVTLKEKKQLRQFRISSLFMCSKTSMFRHQMDRLNKYLSFESVLLRTGHEPVAQEQDQRSHYLFPQPRRSASPERCHLGALAPARARNCRSPIQQIEGLASDEGDALCVHPISLTPLSLLVPFKMVQ